MATITGSGSWLQKTVHQEIWTGFAANADVGTPLNAPGLPDKSVSFDGTFAGTPTIILEGSSDAVNYDPLHDINGNPISFTAAGTKAIAENLPYIRPRMTAGTGGAAINCRITSTKAK